MINSRLIYDSYSFCYLSSRRWLFSMHVQWKLIGSLFYFFDWFVVFVSRVFYSYYFGTHMNNIFSSNPKWDETAFGKDGRLHQNVGSKNTSMRKYSRQKKNKTKINNKNTVSFDEKEIENPESTINTNILGEWWIWSVITLKFVLVTLEKSKLMHKHDSI